MFDLWEERAVVNPTSANPGFSDPAFTHSASFLYALLDTLTFPHPPFIEFGDVSKTPFVNFAQANHLGIVCHDKQYRNMGGVSFCVYAP